MKIKPNVVFELLYAAAATRMEPSADEATQDHWLLGAVVGCHVAPESVEVYIGPPWAWPPAGLNITADAATNLSPSADEATEVQLLDGAPVRIQVAPELLEA
jgi:hypothetical protein